MRVGTRARDLARVYQEPRLVTRSDAAAIAAATELHRELFPHDGASIDLMSSWVGHPHLTCATAAS